MRTLFPRPQVVGIFRGFSEGGLEFHADLAVPYRSDFHRIPMHGQFLLVQLEGETEAVLGRISAIASEGRLVSGTGEEYGIRTVSEDREIPEDLREQYLRYKINIRVLGVVRLVNGRLVFTASHRRLPHVGARVAFLSADLLREVTGHNRAEGVELGFLSFGEFVYAEDDQRLEREDWMQVESPAILPRFDVSQLVSRRTFVFARAGFGKSNLNKLLFSTLYASTPTVAKRGGRRVPVGTVIFDPEGEYFWPDDKNRPGLCDVVGLEDQLVVFTNRQAPSPYYGSFVAGGIKLDIRRLRPADVIAIALPPDRQDQQNVRKLKGLNDQDWKTLVDEVHRNGNGTDLNLIKRLLKLDAGQEVEALAARGNLTNIVRMLHDPGSQLMDMLLAALRDGKLCVVDVSQLRGTPALILSGLVLHRIFENNQEEFIKAEPQTIPTIAVIEEAQTVLGHTGSSGEGPYVAWVKEGRKYDLGAVMITQQPGSISPELLSQGDNWFVFHLLAADDLFAVKNANAHFSNDLLSSLLNEPLPGHAIFWSSAGGQSYPIPARVLSFEKANPVRDPGAVAAAVDTYAARLQARFAEALRERAVLPSIGSSDAPAGGEDEGVDAYHTYLAHAFAQVRAERATLDRLRDYGLPWRALLEKIKSGLPADIIDESERDRIAYNAVAGFMTETFGPQDVAWHVDRRPSKSGPGLTSWVVARPPAPGQDERG